MNYLAHLFLSCDHEDHLIGNFIADSIKRPEGLQLSDTVLEGVKLHKLIDEFTDNHAVVRQSTHRVMYHHHKYSPVVIDIWYDHFLAKHWRNYTTESLRDFADRMYSILMRRVDDMPAKMKLNLPKMAGDDWLMKYKSLTGMNEMFLRLEKRVSRPEMIEGALSIFVKHEKELESDFKQFFPDLQTFVKSNHSHINSTEKECNC